MLSQIRRKVGRAEQALAFVRNNPFEGPGPEAMVQRLAALVERARELVRLRQERELARARGVDRKETVRSHLTGGLLKLFAGAGQAAAESKPALAESFQPVLSSTTALAFVAAARALIEATRSHLESVQPFGVDATMVEEAAALLAEYDAMAGHAAEAKASRIQARADLFPVAAEIMNLIRRLDGLNRHRFAGDPGRLAAWKSAVRSPGPLAPREKQVPPEVGEDPPAPEKAA